MGARTGWRGKNTSCPRSPWPVPFRSRRSALGGVCRVRESDGLNSHTEAPSVGRYGAEADAAARALLVTLGLHAHVLAFGRGFALRSGAELRPAEISATWLGPAGDRLIELGDSEGTRDFLDAAISHAKSAGVPLDGWDRPPLRLTPKDNLRGAILATWPELTD